MFAEIRLELDSELSADRLLHIIAPDNEPLPDGLFIECSIKDSILLIRINSNRTIESLAATIEDIMNAIDLALRVGNSVAGDTPTS